MDSWLKSNSFYENYRKKTPEALECTHILGTTAEQVVVKWSNARPGGINFRQIPAYTEVIVSQMPGGCPGGGISRLDLTHTLRPDSTGAFSRRNAKYFACFF